MLRQFRFYWPALFYWNSKCQLCMYISCSNKEYPRVPQTTIHQRLAPSTTAFNIEARGPSSAGGLSVSQYPCEKIKNGPPDLLPPSYAVPHNHYQDYHCARRKGRPSSSNPTVLNKNWWKNYNPSSERILPRPCVNKYISLLICQ